MNWARALAQRGPVAGVLATIERLAWRVPGSSRRFFLVGAVLAAGALAVGAASGAWVAARNADAIAEARRTGLGLAEAATEFQTRLAAADAGATANLLTAGLDPAEAAAPDTDADDAALPADGASEDILRAADALTDAALVATDDEVDDVTTLSSDLVRYGGLVETSRANARQGFPVASAYLTAARALAVGAGDDEGMVAAAGRLRENGAQRMADGANSVAGPIGAVGVGVPVASLAILAVIGMLVAGRTRRLVHPALLIAAVLAATSAALVARGTVEQSSQLRAVVGTDLVAFVEANDASARLSALRGHEIEAVAAHGTGDSSYEQFESTATQLAERLGDSTDHVPLRESLCGYADVVLAVDGADRACGDLDGGGDADAPVAVDGADRVCGDGDGEVRATVQRVDLFDGDNRTAVCLTLRGASADRFREAERQVDAVVGESVERLQERFDKAAAANVSPLVPIGLGGAASGLALAGVLIRERHYR